MATFTCTNDCPSQNYTEHTATPRPCEAVTAQNVTRSAWIVYRRRWEARDVFRLIVMSTHLLNLSSVCARMINTFGFARRVFRAFAYVALVGSLTATIHAQGPVSSGLGLVCWPFASVTDFNLPLADSIQFFHRPAWQRKTGVDDTYCPVGTVSGTESYLDNTGGARSGA